ncbi:glycoside hydrolase family 16 protein [Salinibacterium soli]|uniref:Glycoside hydrolase family 16 protein n=1 Tax=Antiquaquibacter soli TaxID=3064523 RepID=A0ABT9BRN6_9MICO|nr:glycoside hydrolase family 16 protein [Protaetiibacter sp. WY-16]MDO7882025.1 glycoside hydrolase family 16 protein [Protaetiibacter sp. WY-16]
MATLDRSGLVLEFSDDFSTAELDTAHWFPYYLPHWSSRAATAARFEVGSGLRLRIDEDQAPWAEEWDGPLRATALQTGSRSGRVGSPDGQLRFRDDLVVREEQAEEWLYTPTGGVVELRARATRDAAAMVALYLIGDEKSPERSGELCVMEVFGREVADDHALVGLGIHPWGDPALRDDFVKVRLDGDGTDWHDYAVEWMPGRSRFYIDDELVHESPQAPGYPMQLMLTVYEFEHVAPHPKVFDVALVRGWRRL